MLTQEELKEILDYNSETGVFVWKVRPSKSVYVGDIAGVLNKYGYRCITIKGQQYKAHRLAWEYVYGDCPQMLDHIDGNKDNNSISNLRATTVRLNGQNRLEHRNGKILGCSFHKPTKKWRAQIEYRGRNYHLGLYKTIEEAYTRYKEVEQQINLNLFKTKDPAKAES